MLSIVKIIRKRTEYDLRIAMHAYIYLKGFVLPCSILMKLLPLLRDQITHLLRGSINGSVQIMKNKPM